MNVITNKGRNISDMTFDIFVYVSCALIFLIVTYPLYFVIIASVSDSTLVASGQVILFPKGFSLFGYTEIFQDSRIWTGYSNTIIYSVGGTFINLLFTIPAAYVLSRPEFRAKFFIMILFVFTMFFNGGLIPTYLLMKDLNLLNSMWVFIFNPLTVNVFNLIIARTFFAMTIPKELFEAAAIDGCSHFKFFIKIALPLSKAVLSVIGLYYLVWHWNDFFTGLIYVRDNDIQPLQIVLRDILISNEVFSEGPGSLGDSAQKFADQIKYGVIIVSTLPILVVYPLLQKYFEKGVMIGSIKG